MSVNKNLIYEAAMIYFDHDKQMLKSIKNLRWQCACFFSMVGKFNKYTQNWRHWNHAYSASPERSDDNAWRWKARKLDVLSWHFIEQVLGSYKTQEITIENLATLIKLIHDVAAVSYNWMNKFIAPPWWKYMLVKLIA